MVELVECPCLCHVQVEQTQTSMSQLGQVVGAIESAQDVDAFVAQNKSSVVYPPPKPMFEQMERTHDKLVSCMCLQLYQELRFCGQCTIHTKYSDEAGTKKAQDYHNPGNILANKYLCINVRVQKFSPSTVI